MNAASTIWPIAPDVPSGGHFDQHRVGQLVTVQWEIKHPDLHNFKDCRPWRNKRITSIRKMPTGETCVMLAGHPRCPVRVERLLPNSELSAAKRADE